MPTAPRGIDALQIVEVHWREGGREVRSTGALLFPPKRFVVLVNTLPQGIEVGPLEYVKERHLEPESSVYIIPVNLVERVLYMVRG